MAGIISSWAPTGCMAAAGLAPVLFLASFRGLVADVADSTDDPADDDDEVERKLKDLVKSAAGFSGYVSPMRGGVDGELGVVAGSSSSSENPGDGRATLYWLLLSLVAQLGLI